jgi:hypothetical protein
MRYEKINDDEEGFHGVFENKGIRPSRHERSRWREEAELWYIRISSKNGAGEKDGLGPRGKMTRTMPY